MFNLRLKTTLIFLIFILLTKSYSKVTLKVEKNIIHSKNVSLNISKLQKKRKNKNVLLQQNYLKYKKISCNNINKKFFLKNWYWPTSKNKNTEKVSYIKIDTGGIEIIGIKGQSVLSIASGYVVYIGNNLKGYGNLIIIKHDNNYLSVYAHIETTLVHIKEKVKAGQKIAIMGNTDSNLIKLYFEIFYKGESVNFLKYIYK